MSLPSVSVPILAVFNQNVFSSSNFHKLNGCLSDHHINVMATYKVRLVILSVNIISENLEQTN